MKHFTSKAFFIFILVTFVSFVVIQFFKQPVKHDELAENSVQGKIELKPSRIAEAKTILNPLSPKKDILLTGMKKETFFVENKFILEKNQLEDKIQKYPITFVIKSDGDVENLKRKIQENANKTGSAVIMVLPNP